MSIGQIIKRCRKERNLTQNELAELIGVSMQAVSKWERDVGMPDISQIVPLARALGVSTDKLLGYTDETFDAEIAEIRKQVGGLSLTPGAARAKSVYDMALPFFNKHPDVPEVALICLECIVELMATQAIDTDKPATLAECERYANCVFRYETDADRIYKTYYILSRAYDMLGENNKATDIMSKLPYTFGDRNYWEAEIAFADKKYDIATAKIKESFAEKARFISRCIRIMARITAAVGGENAEKTCLELNEYMLRIINAFLSGGDYLPYRQIYQKTTLLPGLVNQQIKARNIEKAKEHMAELLQTRDDFFAFLDAPEDKHCLMFIEGDRDGSWHATREKINDRVTHAQTTMQNAILEN